MFWAGSILSVGGRQMSMVVQAWLVYDMTGSALQLGYLGVVRAVPGLILGLAGGVIADRMDRRRLMMGSTVASAAVWGGLATLAFSGQIEIWHILIVAFLSGAIGAFEGPSRNAIFPHLIDRRDLANAVALNSAVDPAVRIFSPIIAGVLIDRIGTGYSGPATGLYIVTGLYLASSFLLFLVRMPAIPRSVSGGFRSFVEGMRYLNSEKTVRFLVTMAFVHAFFGMAYTTLLPVFASELDAGASGSVLGVLFAAGGLGGFIGALMGGSLNLGSRTGAVIIVAGSAFGGLLIAFAFAPWYSLTLVLLFVMSMSNNIFGVAAQTVMHARVPDDYRGRVMGFWGMQFTVLHPTGSLEIGVMAELTDSSIAVAINGAVVLAFALLVAGTNPRIRRLTIDTVRRVVPADDAPQ